MLKGTCAETLAMDQIPTLLRLVSSYAVSGAVLGAFSGGRVALKPAPLGLESDPLLRRAARADLGKTGKGAGIFAGFDCLERKDSGVAPGS